MKMLTCSFCSGMSSDAVVRVTKAKLSPRFACRPHVRTRTGLQTADHCLAVPNKPLPYRRIVTAAASLFEEILPEYLVC